MRAVVGRFWLALATALVLALTSGPALACRVGPHAFPDETPISVEVTVQFSEYVHTEDELGEWRAVGRTTSDVPPPLKADEIKFSGYENLFSCVPGYDKPEVGSRWTVFFGINPEGAVRLINLGPVRKP